MNDQKQQIVDKLKGANNILVTVSSNPSVDQLAACIGLTLLLNKLKKHATAVFSGSIPSTIEFLQPENTLEKNTDSLRDFIIALDKSKADKLRYKVEDKVVKIFITPYRTSISQDDLDFSQGDFNVDVVLALGVHEQQDLDQAITSHGRILHDATVASINTAAGSELGTLNWTDASASSLSELVTSLGDALGKDLTDAQIATALLTGIVAETNRFSNEKTSPETMKLSAELMAAGANQQLVATKLQEGATPAAVPDNPQADNAANTNTDNGTLEIEHARQQSEAAKPDEAWPQLSGLTLPPENAPDASDTAATPVLPETPSALGNGPRLVMQPPTMGGTLTANTTPEGLDPAMDALSLPEVEPPMLKHDTPGSSPSQDSFLVGNEPPAPLPSQPEPPQEEKPAEPPTPPASPNAQIHIDEDGNLQAPPASPSAEPATDERLANDAPPAEPTDTETLTELEEAVHSPHVEDEEGATANVDSARSAVEDAINSATDAPLPPIAALNAQPVNLDLHDGFAPPAAAIPEVPAPASPSEPNMTNEPAPGMSPADKPLDMPLPPSLTPPSANPMPPTSVVNDPTAPPPVPPPMMPFSH